MCQQSQNIYRESNVLIKIVYDIKLMAAENGEKLTIIPIIIDLSACMGYIYTFMRSPVICAHAVYIRNRFCFFYNLVVNMHFHPACTCNNGGRCWCMVLGLLAWAKMCVLYILCRMPAVCWVYFCVI